MVIDTPLTQKTVKRVEETGTRRVRGNADETHLELAVFFMEQDAQTAPFHTAIDAVVFPHATKQHLTEWYPYEIRTPHVCLDQLPTAFITAQGVWHQRDPQQERSADRRAHERRSIYESSLAEESQRDPRTGYERNLVRMALWDADHPCPLTPWRLLWRACLLDHAAWQVVYLVCGYESTSVLLLQEK